MKVDKMAEYVEYTEPLWRNLNMRHLNVDEAYVIIKSFYEKITYLYSLSGNCHTCPYTKFLTLHPNKSLNLSIDVAYSRKFLLFAHDLGHYAFDNQSAISNYESQWREFGVYNLTINGNGQIECVVDKEPVNIYKSLISVIVLVTLCLTTLRIALCAWRTYRYEGILTHVTDSLQTITTTSTIKPPTAQRNRMRSLDVFRGLAIILMIFVNSGAGGYVLLDHVPWNGLHIADIIFPCFLWIMGVCIPISIKSQLRQGSTKWHISKRILWRSIKLFLIGLCLNSIHGPTLENLRIMGVLQRFSFSYLICGICHILCTSNEVHLEPQVRWKRRINELIVMKIEIFLMVAFIATHLGIIFGLKVPNCPRGYLGPGGLHANASYPECIGGATGYIDKEILGDKHIYQYPTAKSIYKSTAFDPEGIFGSLLTIVQVFFGVLTGIIILNYMEWKARILRWLIWSGFLALCAGFLCNFSKDDGLIPINKNLWSLSFVCLTTSIAFAVLSILYYVIDVKHWWGGYLFEAAGMNAIIMYIGHTIFYKMLPWHWQIGAMNTHFILMLEALWNTGLWLIIAVYLDSKQFYYTL